MFGMKLTSIRLDISPGTKLKLSSRGSKCMRKNSLRKEKDLPRFKLSKRQRDKESWLRKR